MWSMGVEHVFVEYDPSRTNQFDLGFRKHVHAIELSHFEIAGMTITTGTGSGATGAQGPIGLTGATGAAGAAGATGAQGPIGLTAFTNHRPLTSGEIINTYFENIGATVIRLTVGSVSASLTISVNEDPYAGGRD